MSQTLIQLGRPKKSPSSSASGKKTTVGFVNLGCTKNQVDSEIMLGTLAADGFELTGNPKKAEVVIINTCGFIEEAKQESINTILEHAQLKESGACRVLIAAGCLAQRYQGDLLKELPELDGVVGTGEFGKIAAICRDLLTPRPRRQQLWIGQPPYLYDEMAPRLRLGLRCIGPMRHSPGSFSGKEQDVSHGRHPMLKVLLQCVQSGSRSAPVATGTAAFSR